ncbi:MAG TPA: polyprenyl synthetase family protein, partial [Candidatus Limnocylindrales bacterium]|nr:polyprenyl synthetase family protein [Candidatus Limnocylindrales bacterium]
DRRDKFAEVDLTRGATGIVESLEDRLPVLRNLREIRWVAERLDRLYRCLPEAVVAAGGMGKVVRTMMGVLLIGAYDTRHAARAGAREHLERILPAAYAYGAAYAIVDDTLHDMPGDYLSDAERQNCHDLILRGLTTDAPIDPVEIPDHPLAEELHDLYQRVTHLYPRRDFPHLYRAAESMYQAQHRDSAGPTEVYRFIKAGMSRVVANILGRRVLDDGFYSRCINTIPASQWRDDLIDHEDDLLAGRTTPFTVAPEDGNPLYDLFAYNAYVAAEVFGEDPAATDALTYRAAGALARYLAAKPGRALALSRRYETTAEMSAFLRTAAGMSRRAVGRVDFADQQVKRHAGRILGRRDQNGIDVRTFVADRMRYINDLLRQHLPRTGAAELDEVVGYAIAAGGKRLRPALSLMLAQGLGIDPAAIGPALAASEFLHTASLLFDDLPAQDDATLRRGRPAAHLAFDEGTVQLAALSMIFSSFGLVAGLDDRFPAHKVTEVLAYLGAFAGPRLCRGAIRRPAPRPGGHPGHGPRHRHHVQPEDIDGGGGGADPDHDIARSSRRGDRFGTAIRPPRRHRLPDPGRFPRLHLHPQDHGQGHR